MNRKTYILFVLMIIIAGGVIDNSSIMNNNIVPGVIEKSFNGLPSETAGKNNNQELGTEQKNTNDCIEGPRTDPVLESLAGVRRCNEFGQ